MKILNNKNLTQKIIIAIVIMISFNFIAPTYSHGAEIGGVLFGPVIDLIAGIGDAVMALLQVFMDGGENEQLSSEGFSVKSDDFTDEKREALGMTPDDNLETRDIKESELDKSWFGYGSFIVPIIKYSPEKIFSNEVPALDANFINPKTDGYSETQQKKSIAIQLQETISSWYNALRNLVVVGLLSVLLYVGIRMMITSVASDKAKYKQMLMDWLIALCLVFFLHYIMSFTMTFVDIITEGLGGATDINVNVVNDSGETVVKFKTTLAGYCRMQIQYQNLQERLVYLIFYIALVVYTFMFTWKYMKRAITMAFLTLMAPLVTLTYPIDKMGDGKAQAFNMWLKEYIFNALLQPFHLIIYSIFLGASMNIAVENTLYAILFLAFITPAEKILRKFFGFDKASTAGTSFAGGFGGAAAFNMVKGLVNKGAKGIGAGKGGNGSKGSSGNIRQQKQLTDPNAPDGSLTPFLAGTGAAAMEEKTGSADQNDDGVDYTRAAEAQRLREQGISQDEIVDHLNQTLPFDRNTGANTSEDDKRGVLEWGRDAAKDKWDNSQLKDKVTNNKFVRKIGNGAQSVKQMASSARDTTERGIKKIPKPIRNSIRGAWGVTKDIGKSSLKLAGRGIAAGTMGAVGLGMGIAGDDLEDVFKYGLGGAALGYTTGPALASSMVSGISGTGNEIRSSYETGAYGAEEAALREQDRQFISNQENRNFFEERMTEQDGHKPARGELNQTMEVAAEYNRAGISDLKQINKSMLLEKELQKELQSSTTMTEKEATRSARDQAMTIAKIANGVDAKDLRDKNKLQQLQDSFTRELKSKDSSLTDQAAEAQASRIIAMVKKQKKVY